MHENGQNDSVAAVRRDDQGADRRSAGGVPEADVDGETPHPAHVRRDGLCAVRVPAAGQTLHAADHHEDQ